MTQKYVKKFIIISNVLDYTSIRVLPTVTSNSTWPTSDIRKQLSLTQKNFSIQHLTIYIKLFFSKKFDLYSLLLCYVVVYFKLGSVDQYPYFDMEK